jgi:hypothetical protein
MRTSLVTARFLLAAGSSPSTPAPPAGPQGVDAPPAPNQLTILGGTKVDAPPAHGFQVVLPIVKGIAPQASEEWCTWTDRIADADLDVQEVDSFQSKTGHHVVIFYTERKEPAGTTRLCTDDDMASFRFVSGGGEGAAAKLPGNLVARVPKGAQIVANHHYLNPGLDTVDAQSAVNVRFADPGVAVTRTSAATWLDTQMRAKPGHSTFDVRCTMKQSVSLWMLKPHMHAWGEHIIIERTRAGAVDRVVDVDGDPDFTFHPPEVRRDPAAPYELQVGDEVHVQCKWNNTTDHDLPFGLEMCVAFGQTVDGAGVGNLLCDGGNWGTF